MKNKYEKPSMKIVLFTTENLAEEGTASGLIEASSHQNEFIKIKYY